MNGECDDDAKETSGEKKTHVQLLHYTGFSLIGFAIEAILLALLTHGAGMNPYLARFPAWMAKVAVTFPLNRKVTFRRESSAHGPREFGKYVGSQAGGDLANFAVYMSVLALWKDIPSPVIALMIGAFLGYAINFTLSKIWVFGNRKKAEDKSASTFLHR